MSKQVAKAPLLVGLLVLVSLVTGGGYWWLQGRFIESTDNAYIEAEMAVMAARVAGYVEEVFVVDNQIVAVGQPLFRLNSDEYQVRVEQAEAELVSRQAAQATLAEQVRLQDSVIKRTRAELSREQAEQERAQQDYDRYRALINSRATSRQQLALSKALAVKAQASVEAAVADLEAQRQRLVVLRAQQQQAAAGEASARVAVKLARVNLSNTLIVAPVAGAVGNKQVEAGQYLLPGRPVITVVPLHNLHIIANFKETQVAGLRIGQPVQITVDAYSDRSLYGKILSTSPATGSRFSLLPPENATGNFTKIVQRIPVRIALPEKNPLQGLLRPGLSVVVDVDTREAGTPLNDVVARLFVRTEAQVLMQ